MVTQGKTWARAALALNQTAITQNRTIFDGQARWPENSPALLSLTPSIRKMPLSLSRTGKHSDAVLSSNLGKLTHNPTSPPVTSIRIAAQSEKGTRKMLYMPCESNRAARRRIRSYVPRCSHYPRAIAYAAAVASFYLALRSARVHSHANERATQEGSARSCREKQGNRWKWKGACAAIFISLMYVEVLWACVYVGCINGNYRLIEMNERGCKERSAH